MLLGHEIPVGCEVLTSTYVTHRDPSIYEEPSAFKPERWLDINPGPFEIPPLTVRASGNVLALDSELCN